METKRYISLSLQLFVFVFLAFAYYVWTWSDNLRDLGGDSAIYLLTAQYYSPWSNYNSVAADFSHATSYPPLFPFLLGIVNLGNNVAFAHAMTTSFLLAAFICLYIWMRALGQTLLIASMSILLFALLPGTYVHAISILSENLYLLCTLTTFVAMARFEKCLEERFLWVAACGVALSMLIRNTGIALYLAFLAYLFIRQIAKRWWLGTLVLLPFLLWQIVHGLNQPGYVSSFLQKYRADSSPQFFTQLYDQIIAVGTGWLENFYTNSVGIPVAMFIGVLCLGGMVRRLYLKQMDGFYVLVYLLLISLWPFPAESKRLVFVIIPILLVQGIELIRALPSVSCFERRLNVGFLFFYGSVFLTIFPAVILTATQFIRGDLGENGFISVARAGIVPDNRLMLGMEIAAVENDLRKIAKQLRNGDCIYSTKPSIVSFYTSKKSIGPPLSQVSNDEFRKQTSESGCRFFYIMALVSPTYGESLYPLERLVPDVRFHSFVTLKVGDEQRIFCALVERIN